MPTYVVLGNFTQEGISKIKETPKGLETAQGVFKKIGGEIKHFYYTMGQYDFIAICEAPNEEAMAKALLIISGTGEIRTNTLTAISTEKAAAIFEELT